MDGKVKIVCISDTHGQHSKLEVPMGDLLLHAGDVSRRGSKKEIVGFLDWFGALPHPHKIFIAGNHDFYFQDESPTEIEKIIPNNVIYLNDSGVEINGIKIWGSPVQPWFYDWAFNRQRGAEIDKHWQLIPSDTDILITHGPAFGFLDETSRGEQVGCEELTKKIESIKPSIFLCGHIHEAYGERTEGGVHYINASVLNLQYQLVNAPILIDYEG